MQMPQDTTALVSEAVSDIGDPLWRFELAAMASASADEKPHHANPITNAIAQIAAFKIAIATLALLIIRHGGSSPSKAAASLQSSAFVAALHAEDTTRTRHLRTALIGCDNPDGAPLLLLGRPFASINRSLMQLDPKGTLGPRPTFRPLSWGSYLRAFPKMVGHMVRSIGQTARYKGAIPFRDRVAMAYRIAQGAAFAAWWQSASKNTAVPNALFGHTGNADTSALEIAMQSGGTRTAHVVHGTNIGWPFAGLSDLAIFPSGADARLGASLPAYGRCIALPLSRPPVSAGDGNWALLTSYTHLQHPSFKEHGAGLDIQLVDYVRAAAELLDHDPASIFWRPHPQINLVDPTEKERLENAVADAGFTRWPEDWPYSRLGAFSAAITSPSTVLTDALRHGQPAIIVNLSPLQRDLLYHAHPLLVRDQAGLVSALGQVLDPASRSAVFERAWNAIGPGGNYEIREILTALSD